MGQFCFLLRYLRQPQKTFMIVIPGCGPPSTPPSMSAHNETNSRKAESCTNGWGCFLAGRHVSLVHDALQDGGKRCDADACSNEDGVLRGKDLSSGSPVRSVYVTLKHTVSLRTLEVFTGSSMSAVRCLFVLPVIRYY